MRFVLVFVVFLVVALALVGCGGVVGQTATSSVAAAPTTAVTAAPTTASSSETTAMMASTTTSMADATTAAPDTTVAADTTSSSAPATTQAGFYKTYTGTGAKIINIGDSGSDWFIVHLTCKGKDMSDVVKVFDASGQETYVPGGDFSIIGLTSYDGRVLMSPDVVKIQLNGATSWTLQIQPLSSAKPFPTPGTVQGKGDEVFKLGGNPTSITMSANKTGDWDSFVAYYYPEGESFPDQLGNDGSDAKYSGVAVVNGPGYVSVSAEARSWTLTSAE